LGEHQAQKFAKNLPVGHGFTCFDTSQLPTIFNALLTETVKE
jgi:hypothetical protein